MPELKSGLMWRMDARKPSEAAAEIMAARDRFTERMGALPTMAFMGEGFGLVYQRAYDLHLFPDEAADQVPMRMLVVRDMPMWDILITGDEPKEA